MCWYGKLTDEHIADKDIKCWKIVVRLANENIFRPYYRHKKCSMTYEVGKVYFTSMHYFRYPDKSLEIYKGLHCYSKIVVIENLYDELHNHNGYKVTFPQANEIILSSHPEKAVLLECIIPKGTLYYVNDKGEIVAEKLKLIREI